MSSATTNGFQGFWKGNISMDGISLELHLKIENKDERISCGLSAEAIGMVDFPSQKVEIVDSDLKLSWPEIEISMKLSLKDDQHLGGEITTQGNTLEITFEKSQKTIKGNPELPSSEEEIQSLIALGKTNSKYAVSDYFARPKASAFKLSPDGRYLSYREKDEKTKRHIYVKNIETGEVNLAVKEDDELIRGYGWANNERLFFAKDKGGDENYHIFAVDISGENLKDLTPFENVKASIIHGLKEDNDHIIISLNKNNPQIFEPYKLNVFNGELTQLYENPDPTNPIQDYNFDKTGTLRAFSKLKNGIQNELYYKNLTTNEYELHLTTNWDDSFSIIMFNYPSGNNNEAYVITNLDSDKARIILYDFAKKEKVREVFSNEVYDVSGMSVSRKRNYEIDYFAYNGEKYTIVPDSDFYKQVHEDLTLQFPEKEAYIADHDDDENTFLIIVQSDKLYGTYYEYDVKNRSFKLLYDLMPHLKEEDMAEMKPIAFKSRDGLDIYGYLTLPKKAINGEKVPLIVNPHGGPQGVRDSWGFNPEAQLFASMDWATLQVNFRISGGYGKEFLRAGFKQIGRKLMDDVEDGVQYVIDNNWVDSSKIAIYGASHGGYATLMGLVKTPDLYCCGVDYVGVSNIFTFFDSFPEYWKPYTEMVKQIWYDLDKEDEREIAKEVSPFFQIDKITKPLYVVQGANDPRVKITESDQIVEALRKKGVATPYLVKYDEGHGFAKEENSIEFYESMIGFLHQYLKSK
jgi:dipeptidyl aminopeptidase/acylaminoacyl peptidase